MWQNKDKLFNMLWHCTIFQRETVKKIKEAERLNCMNTDLSNFMIPKELLAHCRGARTRYEQHLAESKKNIKPVNVLERERLF